MGSKVMLQNSTILSPVLSLTLYTHAHTHTHTHIHVYTPYGFLYFILTFTFVVLLCGYLCSFQRQRTLPVFYRRAGVCVERENLSGMGSTLENRLVSVIWNPIVPLLLCVVLPSRELGIAALLPKGLLRSIYTCHFCLSHVV